MPCSAIVPNLTAREQARFLNEAIPPGLFKVEAEGDLIPWRISPEPFALSPKTLERIATAGNDLFLFYQALNTLYNRSVRGTAPSYIAEYLDQGKPEHIVRFSRQNRFKQDIPGVIRPDFILTDDGFIASELDSIPGGMGFVGAMAEAYCKIGYESVGGAYGIPQRLAEMLQSLTGLPRPVAAIVVSEESADYRAELRWLADAVERISTVRISVCEPNAIVFTEEALFVRSADGREEKIDALYRNFELFDLLNVPKHELMLYAARHNRVKMTPPPKAHLEEKLAFALFHHPGLSALWKAELGKEAHARLERIFPKTWIIDPRPLPPQGVIHGLEAAGSPVHEWSQLANLTKTEREFVVKPSGFSQLAWGSRGVRVANDLTKDEWAATLDEAVREYGKTPRILQRFHKGKRVRQHYWDRRSDEVREFEGRVRLCPYYFVTGSGRGVELGGILATVAPADKRLIHGMSDAVMTPCFESPAGY
jgi:hypothetical protein